MNIRTVIDELDQELQAIDAGHGDQARRSDVAELLHEAVELARWNAAALHRSIQCGQRPSTCTL